MLVLTKSDLVDPVALEGWKRWVKEYWNDGLVELEAAQRKRRDIGRDRVKGSKGAEGGRTDGESEERPEMEDVQVVCVRSYDTELLYAGTCT